mmetsp:Transcript_22971/g.65928  ORF Transcript_22971/g.65928 Transcript_22971/m.65928 type:complete len:201 (-) Transcript_22971:79-681(-)
MVGSKMMRNCSQSMAASGDVLRSKSLHKRRTSSSGRRRRRESSSEIAPAASRPRSGGSPLPRSNSARSACTRFELPATPSANRICWMSSWLSPVGGRCCRSAWAASSNFSKRICDNLDSSLTSIGLSSNSSSMAFVSPSSPSFWATPMALFCSMGFSEHSPKASSPFTSSAMCRPCSAPAFFSSLPAASPSSASRRMSTF